MQQSHLWAAHSCSWDMLDCSLPAQVTTALHLCSDMLAFSFPFYSQVQEELLIAVGINLAWPEFAYMLIGKYSVFNFTVNTKDEIFILPTFYLPKMLLSYLVFFPSFC